MKSRMCGLAVGFLLSACSHMTAVDFEKSEYSGTKDSKVALVFIEPKRKNSQLEDIVSLIGGDENLQSVLRAQCGAPEPAFTPQGLPVGPLVATIGKLLFDLFMDGQIRQVEGLKKAAQAAYSDRQLITAGDFRRQRCALLVRYKQGEKDYGLIAVIRVIEQSDHQAFIVEPIYVRAKNAVAITEKPGDAGKLPTIGIAMGISIRAIAKQRSNLPSLQQLGEGVVSVPKLDLGPKGQPFTCLEKCPSSDLVPYPGMGKEMVSISVSVAESGKISVDFDQSIAELKAIKEAIGPVLRDALKEALKD